MRHFLYTPCDAFSQRPERRSRWLATVWIGVCGRWLASPDRDSERTSYLPPTAGTPDDDPFHAGFVRSLAVGSLVTPPSAEMPASAHIGGDTGCGVDSSKPGAVVISRTLAS
jgi:hypothetical protein